MRKKDEGRKALGLEENKATALSNVKVAAKEPDPVTYTDGSVMETKGSFGIVVKARDADGEEANLGELSEPAGSPCSSKQAELWGVAAVLDWLERYKRHWKCAVLATDSRSSMDVVRGVLRNPLVARCRSTMEKVWARGQEVNRAWMPSHLGTVRNEKVDGLAKGVAGRAQEEVGVLSSEVRGRSRRCSRRLEVGVIAGVKRRTRTGVERSR